MFFVNTPPVRDYRDPWTEDFWSRFSAFRNGRHRVAYIYEKADNSTFRYRAYNMVQTLAARSEGISAGYFFLTDGSRLETVVKFADTIVFCRMRYESTLSRLVALARSRGTLVLYDVDDLVFDTDLTHLILGALAQDFQHPNVWDHWFAYISRIGVALRSCDAAITTNSQLATRISDFTGKPAFIVPNYMNRQQLDFSKTLYEEKRDRLFERTQMIHVGYFSGTPTHKRDFDMVVPALCALMKHHANVRLLIVGYLTLPPALERFRPDLVVVACGFDASALDPLGRMLLTAGAFGDLTRRVLDAAERLCGGRLVLSHEGGYSAGHVPFCGLATIEALSGLSAGIEDPFAYLADVPGQELQPHQGEAVAACAELVERIP